MSQTKLIPLSDQTSEVLTTIEAAHYLRLKPKSLCEGSIKGDIPIKPLRYQRHLMWKISDVRKILAGEI